MIIGGIGTPKKVVTWKAINTHRTDVTENLQIDDVILKIFVLHMYLSCVLQIELISITNI